MNITSLRPLALAVAVSCLVACQGDPKIQVGANGDVKAAVDAAVAHGPERTAAVAKAARDRFVDAYITHPTGDLAAPMAVDGMRLSQFIRFTANTVGAPRVEEANAHGRADVDPGVTRAFLSSLRLDKELLESARDRAQANGKFTVDQFEWARPAFVAPPEGALTQDDHATFAVNFVNRTEFDVFQPVFHLRIALPTGEVVFDDDLKSADKTPLEPNAPALLTYTCCSVATDALLNQRIKKLPAGTQFDYALVAIQDYRKKNVLDGLLFDQARYDRLKQVTACLSAVEGDADTWIPAKSGASCNFRDPTATPIDLAVDDATQP